MNFFKSKEKELEAKLLHESNQTSDHSEQSSTSFELEYLDACPICKSRNVTTCYSDLTDIIFKTAEGRWSMKQCLSCASAFLDPRPNRATIGLAYASYYTHSSSGKITRRHLRGFFRRAINGRTKRVYDLENGEASIFWGAVLDLIPYVGGFFDPLGSVLKRAPKSDSTLLDFGCGNGRFMTHARELGWNTLGVDFDEKALTAARKSGHNVRLGGIESIAADEYFDVIYMSHVIEHVHDPVELLKKCHHHLRPGGQLHIETPNFDALGRQRYGIYWRGLECPRHLVLFTQSSLISALESASFKKIVCNSRHLMTLAIYGESKRLQHGKSIEGKGFWDILNLTTIWDGLKAILRPSRTEFIRVVATKND